jgi:hypothetical protein
MRDLRRAFYHLAQVGEEGQFTKRTAPWSHELAALSANKANRRTEYSQGGTGPSDCVVAVWTPSFSAIEDTAARPSAGRFQLRQVELNGPGAPDRADPVHADPHRRQVATLVPSVTSNAAIATMIITARSANPGFLPARTSMQAASDPVRQRPAMRCCASSTAAFCNLCELCHTRDQAVTV